MHFNMMLSPLILFLNDLPLCYSEDISAVTLLSKCFFSIPAIQGNIFMMNRTFFQSLGGFDPGMKVWGAEQFELSFKVRYSLLCV